MESKISTITAISTPPGTGGIAVIRLSGPNAFRIADSVWKGTPLSLAKSHTAHLGEIIDSEGAMLDQAVATVFHEGKSFTGEQTVEFSIHGAKWLQKEVINRLIDAGATIAQPGEFSRRAFLNGRMDLAQAEGVADLIAASSKAAHRIATSQMKGTFSRRLNELRQQITDIASLLELELDFSEEDVSFADHSEIRRLCNDTLSEVNRLSTSFRTGKALKEGVNVVIAGIPNAGKSTLLNTLLEDEKAIVSEIPGTTRDIIEDTAEINGILFRFTDTAGLHDTADKIERIGIDKARERIIKADILLWVFDPTSPIPPQIEQYQDTVSALTADTAIIRILNKSDLASQSTRSAKRGENTQQQQNVEATLSPFLEKETDSDINCQVTISAKNGEGTERLIELLSEAVNQGHDLSDQLIVTNSRHYEALKHSAEDLKRVISAIDADIPADLIAQDLRAAIHHLGTITGTITTDTLLQTIFTRFCIGK